MVVAAVLLAALCHATWNSMAKATPDQLAGFTALSLCTLVVGVAGAALAPLPDASAWVCVGISGAIHVVYMLSLVWCYRIGDFNQVYPIARGTSPLLVTVIGAAVLGETPSPLRMVGVALVVLGLLGLSLARGGDQKPNPRAVLAALFTGLTITTYTVVDGVGVRRSGSVIGYAGWLFAVMSVGFVLVALVVRRRALVATTRPALLRGTVGGLLSVLAYGLVLAAQTTADLGVVSALRETSIVFGAVIGAVFLREPLGRRRVVASAVVMTGVLLIA